MPGRAEDGAVACSHALERPATTYRSLLALDSLLDLQPPFGPPDTALEQHFFVVLHQSFELWFKQIIQDVDAAIADLERGAVGRQEATRKLRRVVAVERMLIQQMRLMSQLDRDAFLSFRNVLGRASGAESTQFRVIQERLDALPKVDDLCEEIEGAWRELWSTHLTIVEYFIGTQPGTGGTSGVDHLQRQLDEE